MKGQGNLLFKTELKSLVFARACSRACLSDSKRMAVVYGSAGFPAIVDTSEVQFYYMESPLPFNAPQSVWTKAGTEFGAFVSTHCGIGVYDTSTSSKFSIEFIAANYTGALLPTLIGNSSMVWNNVGELAVTSPFQESSWIVSRLVSITSGTAYRELVGYLQTVSYTHLTLPTIYSV